MATSIVLVINLDCNVWKWLSVVITCQLIVAALSEGPFKIVKGLMISEKYFQNMYFFYFLAIKMLLMGK